MQKTTVARWLLIAAIVIVFGLFGIDKLQNPLVWIGWMPPWLDGFFGLTMSTWLTVVSVIEIILAAALLIPVRNVRRMVTVIIAVHLLVITMQVGWNDVGIRDAGLFLSSAALFFLL
jgi:uncharacterized membrane protein